MSSAFSLWLLLAGYLLVAIFIVLERTLRRTAEGKTFRRGNFDRGSTLLIGSAFGLGIVLPLALEILGIGLFSINMAEGFLALVVMITGIGLRVWAARTLGDYYTRTLLTTEVQKVITTGPYSKIRHPGYLGSILLWSGFGVLSGDYVAALLFPVMFVAAYLYRIRVEERMLVDALGEEYSEYKRGTYRLVPYVY